MHASNNYWLIRRNPIKSGILDCHVVLFLSCSIPTGELEGSPVEKGMVVCLPREVLGNKLLERTLILIDGLEKHGNFWTLENPASSYAWHMPGLKERMSDGKHPIALLHQCAYGLKLKDSEGGPCKKHIRFLGNLPTLPELSRMCHCHSKHVHAVGGVRTPEGWKRRSELAGHYAYALYHKYATLAGRILPP